MFIIKKWQLGGLSTAHRDSLLLLYVHQRDTCRAGGHAYRKLSRNGRDRLDRGVVQILGRDQGWNVGRVDDLLCALSVGSLEADDQRELRL